MCDSSAPDPWQCKCLAPDSVAEPLLLCDCEKCLVCFLARYTLHLRINNLSHQEQNQADIFQVASIFSEGQGRGMYDVPVNYVYMRVRANWHFCALQISSKHHEKRCVVGVCGTRHRRLLHVTFFVHFAKRISIGTNQQ